MAKDKEEIKIEKEFGELSLSENKENTVEDSGEKSENKERTGREEVDKIMKEVEKTELNDDLKAEVNKHAESIKHLEDDKKVLKLLDLAKDKGVIESIKVARKIAEDTADPYILDKVRDKLAENEYYKSLPK